MLVGKKILENRKLIFKLGNISIPVKDTIRYLGFQLDSRFKWLDHLDIVNQSLRDFTANIKRMSCRHKGIRVFLHKCCIPLF